MDEKGLGWTQIIFVLPPSILQGMKVITELYATTGLKGSREGAELLEVIQPQNLAKLEWQS